MDKVRIFFDREGNSLSVWFDDPKKEGLCEESDDDVVLVKDRRGRVIGFERLNFLTAKQLKEGGSIPLEVNLGKKSAVIPALPVDCAPETPLASLRDVLRKPPEIHRVRPQKLLSFSPNGARPFPSVRVRDQATPDRVGMDILNHAQNHLRVHGVLIKAAAGLPEAPLNGAPWDSVIFTS